MVCRKIHYEDKDIDREGEKRMLSTTDIVMFALGGIVLLLYLILYFMGLKYNSYFDVLDEKEYPLKEALNNKVTTIKELEEHLIGSDSEGRVKSRRIIERIKQLTEDMELVSINRRN